MKCENCRKTLYQGLDVFQVRRGVIGPRGFIPLEDLTFCGDRCVSSYYGDPTDAEEREETVDF